VDLVHGLGDRIRLLLAIPDLDYRRDLFDLPQRQTQLEDELFRRGKAAARAFQLWRQQWFALFNGLTPEQLKALRAPIFRAIPPRDPDLYRDDLVAARRATLPPATAPVFAGAPATAPLPEPYASHVADRHPPPPDYERVSEVLPGDPGLFRLREDLREDIRHLEVALDKSFRLLEEVNDFLGLQRQQLDTLTVSLSTLAGGVPGDGLGAKLVRWTTKARFVPKVATTPENPK
jgi:hypothetical protein